MARFAQGHVTKVVRRKLHKKTEIFAHLGKLRRLCIRPRVRILSRMNKSSDLLYLAADFHRALPERIRAYLHARGI